jgi:predicted ATPase
MVAPVIGRKDELATATEFLGRFTNEPAALVVGGEAGIGKTTLWGAILEVARGMGCRVLAARPAESERELSYAALTDLIGPAYDEVRTLLPPPQERGLAAALLREAVPQPTSVRTLGAATTALLGHLSEAGRIVLAVDDLQWIDAVSERVLAFAIRRLPPGVDLVVTFRTEGQVEPPLGLEAAYPSDRLLRVALGPLSIAALHHLILERLGSSFPRPVLA